MSDARTLFDAERLEAEAEAATEPAEASDAEVVAGAAAAPRKDRSPALLLLAVLCVLLAVGTASIQGYRDLAEQRAHETDLVTAIARTEGQVTALEQRIQRLQKDPLTLERMARQELGLVRPEDIVFVFPEPPKPAAPLRAAAQRTVPQRAAPQ